METPNPRKLPPRTESYETLVPKCYVLSQEDCNLFLNAEKFIPADVLQRVVANKPAWRKIDGITQREEILFGEPKILYDRYDAGERVRLAWSQRSHRIVFACGNNEYIPKPGDLLDDRTFAAKLALELRKQSMAALRPQVDAIAAANAASIARLIEATELPKGKTTPYDLFKGYERHASEREVREQQISPPAALPPAEPRFSFETEHADLLSNMIKVSRLWKVRDAATRKWWTVYIDRYDVVGHPGDAGFPVPIPPGVWLRITNYGSTYKNHLDKIKPVQ